MVVGRGAAQLLQQAQVLLQIVGDAVKELVLVHRAVRTTLAAGAVVGHEHDHRALEQLALERRAYPMLHSSGFRITVLPIFTPDGHRCVRAFFR